MLNGKTDYSGSLNGYTSSVEIRNETVSIKIRGKASGILGTSNAYASVGMVSQLVPALIRLENIIKYICISPGIYGQINVDKTTGNIRIGYTCDANANPINIPAGTEIWYEETFSRCIL